jgi:hypothetical protein
MSQISTTQTRVVLFAGLLLYYLASAPCNKTHFTSFNCASESHSRIDQPSLDKEVVSVPGYDPDRIANLIANLRTQTD